LIENGNTGYATFVWIIVPRVISQSLAERGDYRRRDPPERCPTARALVDFRGGYTHAHFTVRPADRDFRGYQLRNVFHSPDDVGFALDETLTRFATSYLAGYVLDPLAPRHKMLLDVLAWTYLGAQARDDLEGALSPVWKTSGVASMSHGTHSCVHVDDVCSF
jgi:hypothetical protein